MKDERYERLKYWIACYLNVKARMKREIKEIEERLSKSSSIPVSCFDILGYVEKENEVYLNTYMTRIKISLEEFENLT